MPAKKKPKKKPGVPVNAKSGVGANTQATPPPALQSPEIPDIVPDIPEEMPEELETIWTPEVSKAFHALQPKQQKFLLVYVRTGNGSEAYRQAYNPLAAPHLASSGSSNVLSSIGMAKIVAKLTNQREADLLLVQKTFREMVEATKAEWVQNEDDKTWENVGDVPDWKARKDGADGLAKLVGLNAPTEVKGQLDLTSRVVIVELPKKKPLPPYKP